jgi:transcription elongation GreA/GreB family factor
VTADGFMRFQDELQLLQEQRSLSTWTRNQEQRLVDLEYLLSTAEEDEASSESSNEVRCGSTVTVQELSEANRSAAQVSNNASNRLSM